MEAMGAAEKFEVAPSMISLVCGNNEQARSIF